MRQTLRAAVAALALAGGTALVPAAAHAQATPKLGYVDVAIVMEQVPGRQQAQQQFEQEANGIRSELQRLNDSLQTLVGNYQRVASTLTAAQRTTREQDLQRRQQEFAQRAQQLQERGSQREQELANRFESLVREAINDIRTTGGYAMIFASGPNSAMLAADRSLDVTDQVLARMRTIAASRPATAGGAPAQPQAAPATGAPVAAPAGAARPRPPAN
jgi:outer membrane protein